VRGIDVIRSDIPWEKLAKIECLYCMDTHECRICRGAKYLPYPKGATIIRKPCWNCKGTGTCPDCGREQAATA
jgi:hypothetical protein